MVVFAGLARFVCRGRKTRQRKRLKLASGIVPEREAKKIAAEILRPMNQGLITVGGMQCLSMNT